MKKEKAMKPAKSSKPMPLVAILAKACHYAQEHIDDADAWPVTATKREEYLQCVSFQMACFLAQNTRNGKGGVEWDIIIDPLIVHPMKTEKQWESILNAMAEDLGGWR